MRQSEPFRQGFETSAAWFYLRSRSRRRSSGTGTTTSADKFFPSALTTSASRSANHAPRGSICLKAGKEGEPLLCPACQEKLLALSGNLLFFSLIKEGMYSGVITLSEAALSWRSLHPYLQSSLAPYCNNPCSIFSWQAMQCFAHGTASSLFCCSSS